MLFIYFKDTLDYSQHLPYFISEIPGAKMFADSKDKGSRANPIPVRFADAIVQRKPHKIALFGLAITGFFKVLYLMLFDNALKHFRKTLRFHFNDWINNAI